MKYFKANKIAALTTAGAVAFANLGIATPVFAANQTKLKLKVSVAVDYELLIPSETTISSAGFNSLASPLGVSKLKAPDKINKIQINASSINNWKLKDETATNEIGYQLCKKTSEESGDPATKFDFTDKTEMEKTTGETVELSVDVADYSAVPDGDYEDTINWSAEVERKATEIKIKDEAGNYIGSTEGVNVSKNSQITLEAEIVPSGTAVIYEWSISDIAVIDAEPGKVSLTEVDDCPNKVIVRGVKLGRADICVNAGGKAKTCKINVVDS